MADWRTRLAAAIREMRGPLGATEITITLTAAQADEMARILEWGGTLMRDTTDGSPARVTGRVADG